MKRDLTSGSVFKNVVAFSLPYLLSYFLQTLYGMADLFIIGQYEGIAATTAVSVGSQVMHMLTVMLVGLAMGSTVSIGQAVGAKDPRSASAAIGNTVTLFLGLSVVLTGVLLALNGSIVRLMSTPQAAAEGTRTYLTICFLGIPFITAYNIISSIFRGLGDSKSPMLFIAAACAVNIGLDLLFMGALHMGPAGAALGTTLSQCVSVVISLLFIRRKHSVSLSRADLKPRRSVMKKLLRIGLPVALQDGFIQVSFILITIIANRRGLTDAAAVGIVEKIIGFVFLIPSSMLSSVSALGAQNIGAGKPERAVGTLRYAVCIAVGLGLAVAGAAGGPVYAGRRRGRCRRAISAGLYLGLRLRRRSVQLQRLFLRPGKIGPVLPAQCAFHPAGAGPRRLSDLPVFPPDAAPHGAGFGGRLAVFLHRLPDRLCPAPPTGPAGQK